MAPGPTTSGRAGWDDHAPATTSTFDSNKITVVLVLGGPGAGKGTQCSLLTKKYGFCHLSAGDLLREEQEREGSEYGQLIRELISEGKLVPVEMAIKLFEKAMKPALEKRRDGAHWKDGRGLFLIDGFPRNMEQAICFDKDVCLSPLVLFYSTSEDVMLSRLLERGKTSGRADDNLEVIEKRFQTYKKDTVPVIGHYKQLRKAVVIDSSKSVEEVHENTCVAIEKVLTAKALV